MQSQLELENKKLEKDFKGVLRDIDEGLTEQDEDIIEDLEEVLNEMEEEDKIKAIKYLKIKFKNRSFLQHGQFNLKVQEQEKEALIVDDDFKALYEKLKGDKMHEELINMLQNEKFCEKNQLSRNIEQNIAVLRKLDNKIMSVLSINDSQKQKNKIHQFDLLKTLLNLIYDGLTEQEGQNKVEMVVGSLLLDQIDEFQFFLELTEEQNPQLFQQFIEYVQNFQMKISTQFQEKIFLNKNLKFLNSLFTADVKLSKRTLDLYLSEALNISESVLTIQNIETQLETLLLIEIDIQICYFQVVWYVWTQYVCQSDFLKDLQIHEGKRDKQEEPKRLKMYERFCTNQKKGRTDDRLFEYFLSKAILFTYERNKSDNFQKYKEEQMLFLIQQQEQLKNIQSFQDLFIISEERFSNLWAISKKQQWSQLLLDQIQCKALKHTIQFMWSNEIDRTLQTALRVFATVKRLTLDLCAEIIDSYFPQQSFFFRINFLCVLAGMKNLNKVCLESLIKCFKSRKSFDGGEKIIEFGQILQNKNRTLQTVKLLSKFQQKECELISQFFEKQSLINFNMEILDQYLNESSQKKKYCLILLSKLLPLINVEENEKLQCFKTLISIIDHSDLQKILNENKIKQVSDFSIVAQILALMYKIYDELIDDSNIKQQLFENLPYYLKHNFYHCQLIYELKSKNVTNGEIDLIIEAFYQHNIGDLKQLELCCQNIFNQNQKIYEDCFEKEQYFGDLMLTPRFLKVKQLQMLYPQNMNIKLEVFNISLAEMKLNSQQTLIEEWIMNTKDEQKFMNLIPIFFNIIKRGENPSYFLDTIDQKKPKQCMEHFNMKTLFQILYNNSNDELKVMLLKFRSKIHPVPFIFQNVTKQLDSENKLFGLNHLLYYIFPQSYTIINFSLSQSNNQIGKTYLINQIFYEDAKPFQICDTSELNKNTIDIMFDFCFNGSRELAIADCHGLIPLQIMNKILQMFQLWIIQMDTEEQLEETYKRVQEFKQIIVTYKPSICFIVRDSQKQFQQKYKGVIDQIKKDQIDIHYMQNLFEKNLNEQIQKNEINNVQKLILDKLKSIIQLGIKINKSQFLEIVQCYEQDYQEISQRMQAEENILVALEEEMQYLITKPHGFYSREAFPLRRYGKQFTQFKNKMVNEQHVKSLFTKEDEGDGENSNFEGQTKILQLFCQIFEQENFYILYLQLVDKLKKFNEDSSKELQDLHQKKLENIVQKKKEKKKSNPEMEKKIKDEIDELKKQCCEIQANIFFKNIGIEIFWREIIQQQENFQPCQVRINPAEVFFKLIEKGEPFEFLDGNELKINQKFLQLIFERFDKKGQERILVLSVLGPQSSGKSTILNKIFGCHFWTSVGRCTKGIYLQLLKVHNKELFENQFDYIMLLDTEGLQSPTQQEADFDKSIALFTLLISDIIIINVKGDITQQFKNLVEMCIYTLGQMATNFQSIKQLSWCFNQNNDTNNLDPFLAQIKGILDNLSKDSFKEENDDQKIDYGEILEINKNNIKILGFSSYEKIWKKSSDSEFKECKQLLANETFSSEAYAYGIHIIKSFVQKFKAQKDQDQLSDINKFVSNIAGNWESIQRLPDLLEFTELIQQQQNKIMKREYDKIINALEKKLNFQQEIRNEIEKEIGDLQSEQSNQYFQDIQKKFETKYNLKVTTEHKTAQNQLNQVKSQNQLSKKVTQKFLKFLDQFSVGKQNDCKTCIFDSIKEKQMFHQKTQRISQINEFAPQIMKYQIKLERYHQNRDEIKNEFDAVWNKTIKDGEQQHNQIFEEFQSNQYNQMMTIDTRYQLSTEHAKDYKNEFMKINKIEPYDPKEKEKIFDIYSKELKQQQLMVLEKTSKHNRYFDIFQSETSMKLSRASDKDLVDIRKFYEYQVEFRYISKQDIDNYLHLCLFIDLKEVLLKCQKHEKNSQFYEFFIILNVLDVKYDRELLDQIYELLRSKKFYQWIKSDEILYFIHKFQRTVFFDKSKKIEITNSEILHKSHEYYPKLMNGLLHKRYNFDTQEKLIFEKQEFLNDKVIFWQSTYIKPKNPQEKLFQYILDAKEPNQDFKNLIPQIPGLFNEIMETNHGWKKLYSGIYNLIQEQSNQNVSKILAHNDTIQSDEEISSFNNNFQINIMRNVEKQVETFNKQFSNYGVILNQLGERCVYYYSVLMIWRFGCYKKWQLLARHQTQLEADKQDLFSKFKNRILNDGKSQSILQAQTLIQAIQKDIVNQFHPIQKQKLEKLISQKSMNSYDLIAKLDYELLLNQGKIQLDEKRKQDILNYIQNQLNFIQDYAQNYIVDVQSELQKEIQKNNKDVTQQISKILDSIQFNADQIAEKLKQLNDVLEIKDYFQIDLQKNQDEYYELHLYRIVFDALLGNKNETINQLKQEYKCIFEQTFKQVKEKIEGQTVNNSDRKIIQFKSYMDEICRQLQILKETVQDKFSYNLNQFNLTKNLEDLKLQMIGCIFQCPMCNRKCDLQTHENSQNHMCYNGHYLRGMNSILVDNIPSLFACEEILPAKQIRDQQSKNICSWSEIQKRYPEWVFSGYNNEQLSQNQTKMMRIWNSEIGKLLCSSLKVQLKTPVYYRQKHEKFQSQERNHYIFMIDSSIYISSQNWDYAERAIKKCIKLLENNKNAKVSVLTFDDGVKIRHELKSAKESEQNTSYIWWRSGGLNLNLAFKAFNNLVIKYAAKKFSRIILFMYTTGGASFPEEAIKEFGNIQEDLRHSVTMIIATEDSSSATLTEIINQVQKQQLCSESLLLSSVQSDDIVADWNETVFGTNKLC